MQQIIWNLHAVWQRAYCFAVVKTMRSICGYNSLMKRLIIFDLDGTLAESKGRVDIEMAQLLTQLLTVSRAAVISGGNWQQFDKQVIRHLPQGTDRPFVHFTDLWHEVLRL